MWRKKFNTRFHIGGDFDMWGWTLWENSQGSSHFNRMWSTDRILTSAKMVTLKNEVAAGETFEISVMCKAPEQEGRYTSFFRL